LSMGMSYRHLQALGITPWVRRGQPEAVVNAQPVLSATKHPGARHVNQPTAAIGTIIVEWPNGQISLGPEDPGGSLLAGILAALDQDCASFQVLQLDTASGPLDLAALPLCGSVVLCFVENWQHQTGQNAGYHWLHLPSLTQMLADRQFKRVAWQQLKPWAGHLK
jgi:hypothetical protein